MNQRLQSKIAAFLRERRKSDGGYAEVTPDDLNQLCTIIRLLLVAKFQRDADGDLPIEIEIVDRTMFEPAHWMRVRYEHKVVSSEQARKDRFDNLITNLAIAMDAVRTQIKLDRMRAATST